MKPSEILERAKALLTEETWWKGKGWSAEMPPPGRYCASTALHKIVDAEEFLFSHEDPVALERSARRLLEKAVESEVLSPWNDHPDTTLEMVHEAYDRAIEMARREEETREGNRPGSTDPE